MLREKLIDHRFGENNKFRRRSHEISRIEGLSDAVFAFAVTLLVVSLEVPKTFDELVFAMRGFGAFAICFALLFVVLFYVYPLRFLFSCFVNQLMGGHGEVRLANGNAVSMVAPAQLSSLMMVFGVGYVAVFAVFVGLTARSWAAVRS